MAGYIGASVVGVVTDGSDVTGNITVGGTVDSRDVSVDGAKLDTIPVISTSSVPSFTAKSDGTTDGYIQLNCSANSHGIKLKSPPHSAGASYTLVFPVNDGDSGQFLRTDGSGVLSWGTDATLDNTKLPLAGGAMTGAITTNSTFDGVDIATRDAVLTSTTTTAGAALPKAGGAMTGAITTNSTFDGRDVAADGVLATNALPKSGGAMTGAITTNSTFDGRDVAADGVLATNALPKSGGTVTGTIIGSRFEGATNSADPWLKGKLANGTETSYIKKDGQAYFASRVMIGTTTEGSVGADGLTVAASGSTGITIRAGASNSSSIYMSDATSGAGEYAGYIAYSHSPNTMSFATASTPRLTINGSGFVGIGATNPDSPVTIQPAAQGVGTNSVQSWMYALSSGSEFDLKLNQVVSSGLVKYAFTLRNNGTSYANNLVLDRGNVGIGTTSPSANYTRELNVHGTSDARIKLSHNNGGNGNLDGMDIIQSSNTSYVINREAGDLILMTGGSERMRIDNSGKIKIGNNTPMWSGQYGGAVFLKGNNSTAARHFRASIVDSNGAQDSSKHLTLDNNGNVTIGAGNLVIGTAGKGIDFSAVNLSFASSNTATTSEILDHYEEGTWTPTCSSGAIGGTAKYTRIGRMVYVTADVVLSGSRGSEGFRIGGLPYAAQRWQPGSMYAQSYTREGTDQVTASASGGSSNIAFVAFGDEASGNEFGNGYFVVSIWYDVD